MHIFDLGYYGEFKVMLVLSTSYKSLVLLAFGLDSFFFLFVFYLFVIANSENWHNSANL